MSSTPAQAAPALAVPATANFFVAAFILALFVLAAIVSAERKDVTQGFDEVAHASYVASIQRNGDAWPALERMRLLDPTTFRFADQSNYLNHPPFYYALLAFLGPRLEGHPHSLLADRLIDVGLAGIGFAALLGLGLAARLPRYEFYAYAVPLACVPVLVPLAGAVNNDALAFLGGAITTLGVYQRLSNGRDAWLAVALMGVVAAGWAKLTGLMLSAGMVSSVAAYLLWRGRLAWTWALAVPLVCLLAALPYLVFILHYGSATPETPAQIALLENGARAAGWTDLPRKSFPAYLAYFIAAFVAEWMPTLTARSALNYAMLAIPVAALACAFAGIALSSWRLWRRRETALDLVVLCGAAAIAATFAIHVTYSYGRYAATGWLMDAYPRYYLPLIAIVPLASLSLAGAIELRWRGVLLGFLITGPIVFRLLGAPLG
jgi:hypothetical protein